MRIMEENLKILLCEDDENLGMLLREYLAAKGYEAELCADGEIGYKAFLKTKFDICVLDVMMPKKDGFTLAQEIRQANADHGMQIYGIAKDQNGKEYFMMKNSWGDHGPYKGLTGGALCSLIQLLQITIPDTISVVC